MEYSLKLNEQQINAIGQGLAELPYRTAQPVLAAIRAQIDKADIEREEKTADGGLTST